MDCGGKLIELENAIYLSIANEFAKNGVPPIVGHLVVNAVCRRFADDALAAITANNSKLGSELVRIEKENKELKDKLTRIRTNGDDVGKEGYDT